MPQLIWTDSVTVEWAPADEPFDETPTWVNITSLVDSVSISRGRADVFELYGAGTCSVTLSNRLGTIDPTAWYRWRQIRVKATATGPTTNVLFHGFIQEIFHDQGGRPKFAMATIQATDLMGVLARTDYTATAEALEKSGLRVSGVATAAGIPGAWQSIATGVVNVTALEDGVYNSLEHLQSVVEAEGGALYTTGAGVITFADRYELINVTSPYAVFSDTYTGTEIPYLYGNVTLTPPGRDYRNQVTFTAEGGTPQTASDVPTGYPTDSLSRSGPVTSDGQALANAEMLLEVFRQTSVTWPESLTVSVFTQNILDYMTALDLRDYCQVEFTPASKTQQTYNVFVESIEHNMNSVAWTMTIGFSSADRWFDAWGTKTDYLILDDATYGLLGTGKLGF